MEEISNQSECGDSRDSFQIVLPVVQERGSARSSLRVASTSSFCPGFCPRQRFSRLPSPTSGRPDSRGDAVSSHPPTHSDQQPSYTFCSHSPPTHARTHVAPGRGRHPHPEVHRSRHQSASPLRSAPSLLLPQAILVSNPGLTSPLLLSLVAPQGAQIITEDSPAVSLCSLWN